MLCRRTEATLEKLAGKGSAVKKLCKFEEALLLRGKAPARRGFALKKRDPFEEEALLLYNINVQFYFDNRKEQAVISKKEEGLYNEIDLL